MIFLWLLFTEALGMLKAHQCDAGAVLGVFNAEQLPPWPKYCINEFHDQVVLCVHD
jgi:hypothetical protein